MVTALEMVGSVLTSVRTFFALLLLVYRGFIDNQEVAVKVQRPNVLAEIALDLHLVREFAPFYKKLTRTASDLQGLSDEWGRGFIGERTLIPTCFVKKKKNDLL